MTDEPEASRNSAIKITLAVVPALLIVSICIALYLGANADQEESVPLVGEVTVTELADYLNKVENLIEERVLDTEEGQRAFRQINAMTMGTLGPENLGYEVFKTQPDSAFGLLWSTIWINAGDSEESDPVVFAIPQADDGPGVPFALGLAEYLTSHEPSLGIRIVFYPPLVDEDLADWIWVRCGGDGETMKGFVKITGGIAGESGGRFSPTKETRSLLETLSEEKTWTDEVMIGKDDPATLTLSLPNQGGTGRNDHAQKLIRIMPLVKNLAERLGE